MSLIEQLKIRTVALLRWSERYTRTDMLYLTRGGFWLSVGQGVALISGLVLAVAMANLIPPEVYGQYSFVVAASGIIGAFALTGMGTAVTQAVARGYEGAVRTGFRVSMIWSLGAALLALGASMYYYLNGNILLSLSFLPIAIATPIILSSSLYQAYLHGKKDFRAATIFSGAHQVIHLVTLVSTLLLTQNPAIIVTAHFAVEALVALAFYGATLYRYKPGSDTDPKTLSYGKHLSFMNVLSATAAHLDKILVFHHIGATQLAIYAFAIAPLKKLKLPENTIANLALPKLSEHTLKELKKTLPKKVALLFFVMLGAVVTYILFAPYLFQLLFPQYMESVLYSQVYALTLLFTPTMLFNKALVAHMKTKELYFIRTIIPLVSVTGYVVLLPIFGIWGVLATALLAHAFGSSLSTYLFYRAKCVNSTTTEQQEVSQA